ncbi:hypothetical protein OH708_03770 [Pseudomonas capsici]|uniref:hypothetical protein n=1 Tax=Pseudomonas capsici TaxID=2810614 RepID=UPI0021F16A93|nr:hypothetical protein [Pseudomonas capsici]MCV4287019.1 hypothetical protein [Pseudomonas capsici]
MEHLSSAPKDELRLEVVIVDNDLPLLRNCTRALNKLGWNVRPFSNPYHAYKHIHDGMDRMHSLVVELSTPGRISGCELALMVALLDPGIRVIGTSEILGASLLMSPDVTFIEKPWSVETIASFFGSPGPHANGGNTNG